MAAREALYALTVLAALCGNPAFLLVDVGASVRDTDAEHGEGGYAFLAMYVLAPEKLAAVAAFGGGGCGLTPGVAPPFRAVLGLRLAATYSAGGSHANLAVAAVVSGQNDQCRPGARCRSEALAALLMVGGALLDLCGVAALVAGVLSPAGLVPALAVGYGATALAGLCAIVFFVYGIFCSN